MINEIKIDTDSVFITELDEKSEQPADSIKGETATAADSLIPEDYFLFELNCDERSYTISVSEVSTLPSMVTIPSTHEGLPVTVIKEKSFSSCPQLSILLFEEPSNIRIIESFAFFHCSGLESVALPDSIERLCRGSFASCDLLQQVYFDSVRPPCLEAGVFYKASKYLLLCVPRRARSNYYCAISWKEYRDLIMASPQTIPTNLGFFRFELNSDSESYSIYSKTGVQLPSYLVIPWYYNQKPVTIIGPNAFLRLKIKEVLISDTIEKIDASAFLFSTARYTPDYIYSESILEQVKFGKNSRLSEIGSHAFAGNLLLREIRLPETVRIIGDNAFFSSGLIEIFIPKNVESIGLRLFYMALNLKRINVDGQNQYYKDIDGVMYNLETALIAYPLGKEDFSFSLPATVTNFGYQIFWGNRYLRVLYLNSDAPPEMHSQLENMLPSFKIYVPEGSYEGYINAPGWKSYKDIIYKNSIIQNGFAIIDNVLIQYVENAPEIVIPREVVQMKDFALTSCSALEAILVEEGNTSYTASDGVLFNTDMTKLINYPPARKALEYEIPSMVNAVGLAAFFDCKGPNVLKVHKQLEVIEDYAFLRCFNLCSLINLDAEDHLSRIGYQSFYRCTSIEEVSFLSLQYSASSAFSLCSELKTITLGPDLKEFRGMVMSADTNYVQIDLNIYALIPPISSGFFYSGLKTIRVPAESLELYKSTSPWSSYQDRIYPLTITLIK